MFDLRRSIKFHIVLISLLALLLPVSGRGEAFANSEVWIIEFDGPVNPGMTTYLLRGLEEAAGQGAGLAIIQLDTPGGLASSMRKMVKAIMNSSIPVVVYVGPQGAGAASAGVMLTVSAHIAAMAPGTNIGAAHPVTAGGKDIGKNMSEKVVNDMASYARGIAEDRGKNGKWVEKAIRESVSITADEALKNNVIDIVAKDIDTLLEKIDGHQVTLGTGKVILKTKKVVKIYYRPGLRDRILQTISDPNIAYVFMMIGLAGLYFELAHPGAIFPGVVGGISLILAFYSFQALPVNYAGLLLIILAIILFVAEAMVASYGILSIGGLISLTLGSIMLFEDVGVSLNLMLPVILLAGGFFLVVALLACQAYKSSPRGGIDDLIEEVGVVKDWSGPEGLIFVHGEYWNAKSEEILNPGDKVAVISIKGLTLKVKKAVP
jgi:membrane-bound serine protease (ClpP class)